MLEAFAKGQAHIHVEPWNVLVRLDLLQDDTLGTLRGLRQPCLARWQEKGVRHWQERQHDGAQQRSHHHGLRDFINR